MADQSSDGSNPLIKVNIDFSKLSETANLLINKVSDGIGAFVEPNQIRRLARAKADEKVIRAEGKLRLSEVQQRGLLRLAQEEGKRQLNIEDITAQALPLLSENARPNDVEDDFVAHFFERCRLCSDKEMQSLWAHLLANEANRPGTISKRTVDLVATLDKSDAESFTNLCTFAWTIPDVELIIPEVDHSVFSSRKIRFNELTHLSSIGLITFDSSAHFARVGVTQRFGVRYYDNLVILELPDGQKNLYIGKAMFTKSGQQLAGICSPAPSPEYFEYILARWMREGAVFSTPLPRT